jgi:hypothetical protein
MNFWSSLLAASGTRDEEFIEDLQRGLSHTLLFRSYLKVNEELVVHLERFWSNGKEADLRTL